MKNFSIGMILLVVLSSLCIAQQVTQKQNALEQSIKSILIDLKQTSARFTNIIDQLNDGSIYEDDASATQVIGTLENSKQSLEMIISYSYRLTEKKEALTPRQEITKLLLQYRQVLFTLYDPTHNFSKPIYMNIQAGGTYSAGTNPKNIKEPDIRKDYEERLEKNAKLARERRIQITLKHLISSVLKNSNEFLINAYSQAPRADAELVELLEKYDYPEEEKSQVFKSLKIPYQILREWQLQDGTKITARFISLTGDNVVLETKDKKRQTVVLSELRDEDQKYAREQK